MQELFINFVDELGLSSGEAGKLATRLMVSIRTSMEFMLRDTQAFEQAKLGISLDIFPKPEKQSVEESRKWGHAATTNSQPKGAGARTARCDMLAGCAQGGTS